MRLIELDLRLYFSVTFQIPYLAKIAQRAKKAKVHFKPLLLKRFID